MTQRYTEEQLWRKIQRIHGECEARDKLLVAFNKVEGISVKQVYELSMLDLEEKEIRLSRHQKFHASKRRTKQLMERYLKKRSEYKPKTDSVFVEKNGRRMSERHMRKVIRSCVRGKSL